MNWEDEYDKLYKLDMTYEWMNSAYDEDGNTVECDICGEEMKWDQIICKWCCPGCEREMSRAEYFNYIGACPPEKDCLTNCCENYPICKRSCDRYEIDEDDPMLN